MRWEKMIERKKQSRTEKAKLNMFFSLLQQIIAFVCGLIVPKIMLNTFGSAAYGTTTSIATFLSYITLLEGGIGAVTRSALYKAFASKSKDQISAVITETKIFYKKIAFAFVAYVIVIACFYKQISHNTTFGYWYSFSLVVVIAFSTFAEYFIGISYSLLLQADQMNYIVVIFRIVTTILNTIGVVVLTSINCDILAVKLLSSIVFVIRPVLLSIYVKRRYKLTEVHFSEKLLVNKRSAIGQHIAWALHNNTDIAVLTVLKDATYVSVYSVYHMVVSQLQSILNSFSSGMEAVFGSMYANKERENLQKTFGYYETLISVISIALFSIAAVLIVPFIRLYTSGITDAEYINPTFAMILIIASLLYSLRTPYSYMIIAAGQYKETRMAAYGEAAINITTSIIFVIKYGLVGVAVGTVLATLFRYVYYVFYLSRHILYRNTVLWIKRTLVNSVTFICIYVIGTLVVKHYIISNYIEWMIVGIIITVISGIITIVFNLVIYYKDLMAILQKGIGKVLRNK